jgi:hypothetical protein
VAASASKRIVAPSAAASFDNPDFVDVVIHSYRHRIGNAPGEPRFLEVEKRLAQRPRIEAPTITLYGGDDGLVVGYFESFTHAAA